MRDFNFIWRCWGCGGENTLTIPRGDISFSPGEPQTREHPGCCASAEVDGPDRVLCSNCKRWQPVDQVALDRAAADWWERDARDARDQESEAAWTRRQERRALKTENRKAFGNILKLGGR